MYEVQASCRKWHKSINRKEYMSFQLSLGHSPLSSSQVRQEQQQVVSTYGSTITPTTINAAPYTSAVVKECLRITDLIAGVPRLATKELPLPGGYVVPAGCPVLVAFSAMNAAHAAAGRGVAVAAGGPDAAAATATNGVSSSSSTSGRDTGISATSTAEADAALEDLKLFKPERWLTTVKSKASTPAKDTTIKRMVADSGAGGGDGVVPKENHPFGMGQRYCLGWALATAELTVMLTELVRGYQLAADTNTSWGDYPILKPKNGLPTTLTPL